ncbi:MAG: hypothetical protein ACMXYD_02880 [Candidatus Woesearchaeota archaeon]
MDQRTFEKKVQELAEKLKQSGVVTSDSMAKGMAEDILRTEMSMKEKYQSEKSSSKEGFSSEEKEDSSPKNLVVEEAIAKAQGTPHQARIGADIDQSKSIAQLLEEDASQQEEEAKITLDTPVVEGGVAKQSVSATVNKTPLEVYEQEVESVRESSLAKQELVEEENGGVVEKSVQEEEGPQETSSSQQEEVVEERNSSQETSSDKQEEEERSVRQEEPSQNDSQETSSQQDAPAARKEEPRATVDLSEMFNFSKK